MALRNFYAALIDEQLGLRHETTALAWMVPAVFLYEAGVWYVMVMGAYLWFRGKGYHSAAWGAWAIAAVALGVNALDLLVRGVNVAGAPDLLKEGHVITTTLGNALLLVKWFLSASFFLGKADLIPVSRMMVRPDVVSWTWPLGQPLSWALAGGAVLVSACLAGAFYCRLFHRGSRRSMAFLAMCLAMLAGYLVIIALGRINGLGAQGIRTCLYYPYNFLILLIAAVALALPFDAGAAGARGKVLKWAAVACFSMVILFNVWTVRRVAGDIARDHRVVRQFVIELDHFVQAHKKEQGFSFYVGPQYPGNYTPDWVSRRGDAPGRMYTLAEALYPQYYSKNRPRYVIQPGL